MAIRLESGTGGVIAGDSFEVYDDWTVTDTPTVLGLFNGNAPGCRWLGVANASVSVGRVALV